MTDDSGQARHVAACREWQRTLCEGHWAGITWPKEFGGRGGSAMQQMIFSQEQADYDVPVGALVVGLGMVGPTLMALGRPDQQERFLAPMLRGEEMWCQLFSEPGAGSDLPSLTTRAERDGDEYVVNGQKVWTTLAQYSDWAILLARTERDVPGRAGISYFLARHGHAGHRRPTPAPDHGGRAFQRGVPDRRPGAGGQSGRRAGEGLAGGPRHHGQRAHGHRRGRGDDLRRRGCARAGPRGSGRSRATARRWRRPTSASSSCASSGCACRRHSARAGRPGVEGSLLKLAYSRHTARLGDLGVGLLGADALASGGRHPEADFWRERFLSQWSTRIGGGTDQIQRNQIAERVLGLPREPSVTPS